jgi:hypothetical protein
MTKRQEKGQERRQERKMKTNWTRLYLSVLVFFVVNIFLF